MIGVENQDVITRELQSALAGLMHVTLSRRVAVTHDLNKTNNSSSTHFLQSTAIMNSHTGFWFPSMKIGEITRALEEWGLRISEDQIQRPTSDVVQAIYILFVQQVTGITPGALEEPVGRASTAIDEFPELYTNSLNLNLVLHHV